MEWLQLANKDFQNRHLPLFQFVDPPPPPKQVALRLIALTAMSGVLLVFLQPPMPLRGGARCPKLPLSLCPRLWDERHIPMHGTEDVEVGVGKGEAISLLMAYSHIGGWIESTERLSSLKDPPRASDRPSVPRYLPGYVLGSYAHRIALPLALRSGAAVCRARSTGRGGCCLRRARWAPPRPRSAGRRCAASRQSWASGWRQGSSWAGTSPSKWSRSSPSCR